MSNVNQFESKEEGSANYPRSIATTVSSSTPSQLPTAVIPNYVDSNEINVATPGHVRYNSAIQRQALLNTSAPLSAVPLVPQVSTQQIPMPHRPGPVIAHASHSASEAALIATSINTSHPNISGLSQVLATGLAPSIHSAAGHTQVQQQFQRLKVEDALSYLDQVKFQFGNQPQVYNDFLDIMKEFKSQSIDTPGVIARVSNLFNGHPDLIVGFNTFLPPGYKIEVSANDQVSVTGPNMVSQTIQPGNGATTIQIHTPGNKYITHTTQPLAPRSQSSDNKPTGQAAIIIPTSVPPVFSPQVSTPSGAVATPSVVVPNSSSSTPSQSQSSSQTHGSTSQPVEFNHAISYVNKIKNRFQGQTDIYKSFLEILHKYQKEQRTVKESSGTYKPSLSETEVYSQVARLFKNDEDLLREFGQFLPDAGGAASAVVNRPIPGNSSHSHKSEGQSDGLSTISKASMAAQNNSSSTKVQRPTSQSLKRPAQMPPVTAKSSSLKDVSVVEASKHGTLKEYEFFDHVRKALGSQEVYENFLRCILLYNNEIIGRVELIQLVQPFLSKYTELYNNFKQFLAYKDGHTSESRISPGIMQGQQPSMPQGKEKLEGMAMEIDYTTLKRLGSSYRALPSSYEQPRCTGRDALCKEVLNDTWVSFPSWSEDSQFVTSRKTQFEEHVYRCEDERFELDVVIETNRATMLVLEGVQKKLNRLSEDEKSKFTLNNSLGGTSEVVHRKSIHRIYGDKATDIIDGLKKNSAIAVPVVLKRLKLKDEEWREAQHQFNKLWGEQNEKYYLKSLDHQGINFKPNDIKFIRSKSLLNEIEAIYDERQEALESDAANVPTGPHMTLTYENKSIIDDTASLIIHHVKRQSSINKDDKQIMKAFMYQTLPDLFFSPRGNQPSDDEDDLEDQDYEVRSNTRKLSKRKSQQKIKGDATTGGYKPGENVEDMYHLLMANNHFYLFFRLHHLLCKRLLIILHESEKIIHDHAKESKKEIKESVADLLRLKKDINIKAEDYYPAFLELVRNLLDGNIESSQFEDQLREMFTIHAYIGFTMDRLVQNIVKQLQHIVQDEQCIQLLDMFAAEERVGATGGPLISQGKRAAVENAYSKKAEMLLTEENCFKILICQKDKQMHLGIILLDTDEVDDDDLEPTSFAKWSQYVDYYAQGRQEITSDIRDGLGKKPVFLQRNSKLLKSCPKPADEEEHIDRGVAKSYGIEIKFAPNSYKIKYVPDTEDIMYRLGSSKLTKAVGTTVSKRLHNKFTIWHTNWERENVSRDMSRQTNNWFMGKIDGLMPSTTICRIEKDQGLSKNTYRVDYQNEEITTTE